MRAGSSVEAIASETGWPLDRVERYAGPLLAERAYVAQLAQAVEVRRSGGAVTGVGVTLADTVARVLWDEGMLRASVTWDARRRDDGKWVVTASFTTARGPVQASWTYDNAGRNLHPIDEAARRLMGIGVEPGGEIRRPPVLTAVHDEAATGPAPVPTDSRPHLVSLPPAADAFLGQDVDPHADLVADEARLEAERHEQEERLLDQEERLLDQERREHERREHELRERQARERELRERELQEHQFREHELRQHELREHQRREQELREREVELREQQARDLQARRSATNAGAQPRGVAHQPTVALPREEPPNSGGKPRSKPKSRRSSVPSWDEILFGATRGDES